MSSLLAIKHWKGQFKRIAGINPDYSYGRNNMAAFVALLKRFNIEHEVVTEQWPKVGTMELTSNVAALKAAKPDLIFSSLLFADLPVFMKQAAAAELTKGTKLVFPAAGFQHTLMKKDFTPGGHAVRPQHALLRQSQRARRWRRSSSPGTPTSRRTIRTGRPTAPISPSPPTRPRWRRPPRPRARPGRPTTTSSTPWSGLSVESLGGKGSWRKDHIADQTFVQGFSTHNNKYDFVTLDPATHRDHVLGRPAKAGRRQLLGMAEDRAVQDLRYWPSIDVGVRQRPARRHLPCRRAVPGGGRAAARVRRAEDRQSWPAARSTRWAPTSASRWSTLALNAGMPTWIAAAAAARRRAVDGVVGPPIERLLRTVYDRDESFQLLLTFALVLMFQDVFRFIWGANPQSLDNVQLVYGKIARAISSCPSTTCW